ncbi:GTPase HflX [Cytobacillus massiliigabonensis]|uniref:GTPase HflX n=1 Tax=Cytobacillus massiliigabonensis TaxID=1871011 RepID=UPI000C841C9C
MKRKAILVGVNLYSTQSDFIYMMEELANLAGACDVEVVGEVTQNLHQLNKSHYIGAGKVEELLPLLKEKDANIVIFDDELSPSQIRNLESELNCEVIDRTMLILEIFANRAKTRESQLQVEVARLKYMLPRLVGMRESLGRQGGGSGLKNRGAGETKLELDRRKIEIKITALNKELEKLINQRKTQRKLRKKNNIPVVSLVGYTNAGKSTIMNAMLEKYNEAMDKQVFEKDMLFATLETSVRKIKLSKNKTFLLTDTVGFINKLPHHLIKAFRSTLEEVGEADLLIHVLDYSSPHHEEQKRLTNEILREIGIEGIPIIYANNKADLTEAEYPFRQQNCVYLSAKNRLGLNELTQLISQEIFNDSIQCELLIPYAQGEIVSYFNENSHILLSEYEDNGTKLIVECKRSDAEKYKQYIRLARV